MLGTPWQPPSAVLPELDRSRGPFPASARVVAAATAGLLLVHAGSSAVTAASRGFPLTAWVSALVVVPAAWLLFAAAVRPSAVARRFAARGALDLREPSHLLMLVFFTSVLYVVVGVTSLAAGAAAYEVVVVHGAGAEAFGSITATALFQAIAFNGLLLVLPVVAWLTVVHGKDLRGVVRALGFRAAGSARAVLVGTAFALGSIVVIGLVSALLTQADVAIPENDQALAIAASVGVLGAIGVAAGAAFTEEIFFRGFLQPRIGVLGQALVFAVAHLSYVNVLQVVVTFVLALGFGWLFRRSGNLWAPVAGHFAFNAVMLGAAQSAGF